MENAPQIVWCHVVQGYDESVPWLADAWVAADASEQDLAELKRDMLTMPGIDMVLSDEEYQSSAQLVRYLDGQEIRRIPMAELEVEREYRTRSMTELRQASQTQVMSWILLTVSEAQIHEGIARLEAEIERRKGYRAEGIRLAQSGITPSFVRDLKQRIVLHEFVVQQIPSIALKRAGSVYQATCPFHSEKTPSFTVYEQRFICFGCGAHGDVFDLCMQLLGLDGWRKSVEYIAEYAGVQIPKPSVTAPVRTEMSIRSVSIPSL